MIDCAIEPAIGPDRMNLKASLSIDNPLDVQYTYIKLSITTFFTLIGQAARLA